MNKDRRAALNAQYKALDELKTKYETAMVAIFDMKEDFSDVHNAIDEIKTDEQDAYDNMPEGLQNGERGELMQEAISRLEEGMGELEEFINTIEANTDLLDQALENIDNAAADPS